MLKVKIKLIQIIKHNFQCTSSLNKSEIKQLLKQYPLNVKIINDNNIAYIRKKKIYSYP